MYRLTLDKECNMDDYLFVAVCIQIANKIEAEERILLLGAIGCFFMNLNDPLTRVLPHSASLYIHL